MPSPSDNIAVLIGGKAHDQWETYEITSDLFIPADEWHVSVGFKDHIVPDYIYGGAAAQVRLGGDTILTGQLDETDHFTDKRSNTLTLTGRDGAAVLVDCSAPIFTARQVTLEEVIAKVVRPLGITRIRVDGPNTVREKINVEPGETAWTVLQNAAEANGLWPWFEPDGTLVVGGPDYAAPVVAELVMRISGNGNNMESFRRTENISERYSEVTLLGQTHGTEKEDGKHDIKAMAIDKGVVGYRPLIVVDHEIDNPAQANQRAQKLIADSRLKGITFTAKVKGHRTGGIPWKPGQRVHVVSETDGLDAPLFISARKFVCSRSAGKYTELTMKEDGVWIVNAHPHKHTRKRRPDDDLVVL
jgi:prophage tail gpP-like protein